MTSEWKLCPFCGGRMQVFLYSSAWGDRYFPACTNESCLLNKLTYMYKPQYQSGYKSIGAANVAANTRPIEDALRKRIAELEEQAKLYTALKDPQSVDAFTAIQLYIQRHFDAEKKESLFRLCGSQSYVEMSNRIKALEAQLCWIPVSERLPDVDPECIRHSISIESLDGGIIYSPSWRKSDGDWVSESKTLNNVTHWRYAKLPKVEK